MLVYYIVIYADTWVIYIFRLFYIQIFFTLFFTLYTHLDGGLTLFIN